MAAAEQQAVELSIGGMTCASCAARIEKKLSKLDGVTATVNFATGKAAVSFPSSVSPDDLIAVVQRTGCTAALPAPSTRQGAAEPAAEAAGQTVVFAGWDGAVRGVLIVSDTVKPASAEAITRLRALGLRPVLLTGDNERAARAVADEVIAGVLPEGKATAVKELQSAGRVVAMAGDGVNAAAALAQADLGWRWAPAPMPRSRPPTSPWSAATCARFPALSGCRAAPSP